MKFIALTILLLSKDCLLSQQLDTVIVYGNHQPICHLKNCIYIDSISKIKFYAGKTFYILSTLQTISEKEVALIKNHLQLGGNLYIGLDNWPHQKEGVVILSSWFQIHFYDEEKKGHLKKGYGVLNGPDSINSYVQSNGYFSIHPNFKIEYWSNDCPVIMSAQHGKGRMIIDGGYVRFFCENISKEDAILLNEIIQYLKQ